MLRRMDLVFARLFNVVCIDLRLQSKIHYPANMFFIIVVDS